MNGGCWQPHTSSLRIRLSSCLRIWQQELAPELATLVMAERSVQRAASSAAQQAGMSFGRLHTRALKKRPSSEATVWPSRSAGCAASCTSGFTACVPVLLSGQRLLFFSLLHLTRSNRYLTTTCFFHITLKLQKQYTKRFDQRKVAKS